MTRAVPVDYQPRVRKPDDFNAFWEEVLRQAAEVPLAPEMIPDPLRTSEDVEVFQVFYTSIEELRIAAWYCRPARQADAGHSPPAGLPDGPALALQHGIADVQDILPEHWR